MRPSHIAGASRGRTQVPVVRSFNTLIDRNFSIVIEGWRGPRRHSGSCDPNAPVPSLLTAGDSNAAQDDVGDADQATAFQRRPESERAEQATAALGPDTAGGDLCRAGLDEFLFNTIVLTPEKLKIDLRKEIAGTKVVEVDARIRRRARAVAGLVRRNGRYSTDTTSRRPNEHRPGRDRPRGQDRTRKRQAHEGPPGHRGQSRGVPPQSVRRAR